MTWRFVSKSMGAGVVLAASVMPASPARACGGFFCSQSQPVNQAAERIIFAQNGDGTVTAVIQILYQGPAENFSWLLPIPSVPEGDDIAVASNLAFERLQQATNPSYNLQTRVEGECRPSPSFGGGGAGSGGGSAGSGGGGPSRPGVVVAASGVVGAFEWTALELDPMLEQPADAAITWLTENGYDITPGSDALIGPYLADGNYLLALRLTKGSDTGSIRPIVLTYDADLPMIPIKLTAVAANENMGVMTWMLSEARAVPMNYNALELNEARINWFNASSNYNDVIVAAADDAGGQGFVTEFAGPASSLSQVVWDLSQEADWEDLRTRAYASLTELFDSMYGRYQAFDGFWDAIRASVTLPESVSFEDFQTCPNCYSAELQFSPSELLAAIETEVIEPIRGVQALIDRFPYVTRLYSTLSAAEMTLDPVFTWNPDLEDVSNVHTAERIIECKPEIEVAAANWRIELPQGGVIRGRPEDVGIWPAAISAQPPNLRVLQLGTTGAGAVLADNSSAIEAQLQQYNDTVMAPTPMPGMPTMPGSATGSKSDDSCSVGPSRFTGSRLAGWGVATLLLGIAGLRWRRWAPPRD